MSVISGGVVVNESVIGYRFQSYYVVASLVVVGGGGAKRGVGFSIIIKQELHGATTTQELINTKAQQNNKSTATATKLFKEQAGPQNIS